MTLVNAFIITYQLQIQNNKMILCCQVLTDVDALVIIFVKDREKLGCGCVRPRVGYVLKGEIPFNFSRLKLMH